MPQPAANLPQVLPSIASLTSNLSAEQSPARLRQHSESREARDSGNWSISQSKRKCASIIPSFPYPPHYTSSQIFKEKIVNTAKSHD